MYCNHYTNWKKKTKVYNRKGSVTLLKMYTIVTTSIKKLLNNFFCLMAAARHGISGNTIDINKIEKAPYHNIPV